MHEIRIPRLGWSMEEGTFVGWLKRSGDHVAVGEPLFELEGEKALQEIESVDAGTLCIPADAPQVGSVVAVGALLGYLLIPGEEMPGLPLPRDTADGAGNSLAKLPSEKRAAAASGAADHSTALPHAGPAVRRLARELAVNLRDVRATGKSGRVTETDVAEHARHQTANFTGTPTPAASPRARRIAAELGIDWTTLRGTGRDGRIREADVRAAGIEASGVSTGTRRHLSGALSPRRKAIADHLRISRERTIPVTLTTVADATNLAALRQQFKTTISPVVPAFTDIVACLVARALKRHPQMALRTEHGLQEHSHQTVRPAADEEYAIGIAVETADGLLVPVVRGLAYKSLLKVAEEAKSLVDRARTGRLTAAEMQGGHFTITNLGTFGIDAFTPVINYPEIAILGLGAIRREAVVLPDDRIVPQPRITLSLTFDHGEIDGAPASAFLRDIVLAMENPAPYLMAD